MTTYLSRPVFTLPANWLRPPGAGAYYDLRSRTAGFGRPGYEQLADFVARELEADLFLDGAAECCEFETFLAAVKGRFKGFWLPDLDQPLTIVLGLSTTQFEITDVGLADVIGDFPQFHLWFEKNGATQAAQINTVVDLGNGKERITLTGALGTAADPTWSILRLLYGTFGDDAFTTRFRKPNLAECHVKFRELPSHYAAAETGLEKVTLFHFFVTYPSTTQHYYFTSHPEDIVSNGHTYLAMPIDHGVIKHSIRGETDEATIETLFDDDNPLKLFFPFANARPLQCEILEANLATPNSTTAIATGYVTKPRHNGRRRTCSISSFIDFLGGFVPANLIQPRCPLHVYDSRTCKADRADFVETSTIKSLAGNVIVLDGLGSGAFAPDRFAGGWLEVGLTSNQEVRDILQSVDDGADLQLTLNLPLFNAAVSDDAYIFPGCQRTTDDCENFFNNLVNFGGCPSTPSENLSIPNLQTNLGGGGKKK